MDIRLNYGVTFGASIVPAGTVIDNLPDEEAQRLVELGDAEYVDQADAKRPKGKAPKGKKADAAPTEEALAAIELQRKALDSQYKRDELAEAAKAAGVEFAFDAKKDEIVDAILAQDKAAALLK